MIFSKVDLVNAYREILNEPVDIQKTAVSTPFGLLEYVRQPFALRHRIQTFQILIAEVTRGLPAVYSYIDDILIARCTPQDNERHLLEQCLQQFGRVVNIQNLAFPSSKLEFLVHYISLRWK